MSRRSAALSVLALVALSALALLIRRPETADASALSASPGGWLAARTYLERRGDQVRLLDRPLDRAPEGEAIVLGFPWQSLATHEELASLRQRLLSGGTVVFAYSGQKPGFGERFAASELGIAFAEARGETPLSPRRWWEFVNAEWRLRPTERFAPPGTAPREVVVRAPDRIPSAPPDAEVLFHGQGEKPAVFRSALGRGRVLWIPADALSNARLGNPGNADLLESLRAAIGPAIAFDEYHHALVSPEAVPRSDASASLDALLIELLLLYLLAAWGLGRRFGPSWREPPEIASSTSAFLLGLGALHRRLRHAAPAALRLIDGAASYDHRVQVPESLRQIAREARDESLFDIARFVARRQRRGRLE